MAPRLASLLGLFSVLAASSSVSAQGGGQTCNLTQHCGSDSPCCSEYGFCGDATFCLGGCNPLYSDSLTSCAPEPVCENEVHTFNNLDRILMNATYYDGNATEYDFILDKGNLIPSNSSGGGVSLMLTESNGGTRISSTRYVHYGTVSARLKTGRWGGVVTAFITMSDIKDEIDWEFPGNDTTEGQTNYFWQGVITNPTHGGVSGNLTDTYINYHDYAVNWQPDQLEWLIDGNVVRTLYRNDTIDDTGVARYPSTPSRIQLSIWPAGINGTAPGTVEWAGGMINWDDPDYKAAGGFYMVVEQINITCADPTPATSDVTSYVYGQNSSSMTPSVSFSNATTINGALGALSGVTGPWGVWTITCAVLFSLVGATLA